MKTCMYIHIFIKHAIKMFGHNSYPSEGKRRSHRNPGHPEDCRCCGLVRINVCGAIYETLRSTLEKYPNTLLGCEERRKKFFSKAKNEYYFDRNRAAFDSILYYYQSGKAKWKLFKLVDLIFSPKNWLSYNFNREHHAVIVQ